MFRVLLPGALVLALGLPACAATDTTDAADPDAQELRAFFEGSAPIPDAAGRDEHRRTLALLAVRASGARRSGVDIDPEEEWIPLVEQAGSRLVPVSTRAWQREGDIDPNGAFVPLRAACPALLPLDLTDLPEEVNGPLLDERAERLACALERASGTELFVEWSPRLPYAALIDPADGSVLVNPRWIALVEPDSAPVASLPDSAPSSPDAPGVTGGPPAASDPAAGPLSQDDNGHHPRPPDNDGGQSSRTFCDRVCDDVWNDVFDCDCDGTTGTGNDCDCGGDPGSDNDGCDCGGDPGSDTDTGSGDDCDCGGSPGSSGGGSGSCLCANRGRGSRDRNGVTLSAAFAGALALRRARKLRAPAKRLARALWARLLGILALVLTGLLAAGGPALAAPPEKLVDVHVTVTPPEAAVFVDGNAVAPQNGVVRVAAGTRTFSAKLEGYATAAQTVEVPERGTGTLVTLRLIPDKGYLIITGSNPAASILIDGEPAGKGSYSGLVAPGTHVVTAVGPAGDSRSYQVTAVAGQSITVSIDGPSTYVPPAPPPPPPPPRPTEKPEPPKPRVRPASGPYALLNLTLLWQTGRPYGFEHGDSPGPGFAAGGRAGYRFNNLAGLELLVEYGRIENGGFVVQTYDIDQDGDGAVTGGEAATDRSPGAYLMESLRLGPVLRLTSSGRVNRFVAGLGIGALHENIALEHKNLVWDPAAQGYVGQGTYRHNWEGWSPYFLIEGGYERSLQSFLLAFLFQLSIESVSGIDGDPYNAGVQARLGLSARFGYALW